MSAEIIRAEVLELMKEKDKIEDEIKQVTAILTQNGVGMTDSLVDAQGFPINSIDIYQVRHARHRIICLQNDHKALMKQIESGLQGYYNSCPKKEDSGRTNGTASMDVEMRAVEDCVAHHRTPFARVTQVAAGSPADEAGLQNNDEIVEFGSINSTNFRNINDVAVVVQHKEGARVNVRVKRGADARHLSVQLVPRKWSGRGLLGCNIQSL